MKQSELPEPLQKKIAAVANAKGFKLRKVSVEEAGDIRDLRAWKEGYFITDDNAQIVLQTRLCGQNVIFRI
ncbi:hypothetical protein [Marinobacter salicampi]|uniref:hypothetical protein n=1 Tax=Marinobacter salicampi TaxID=435907 RepID=UPI00140D81B4|nr:hypothetical protein [Marinobacter salicampi]